MHHKRRRHKVARAGCLLCKPNKRGAGMERQFGHAGWGGIRREAHSRQDLADPVDI